MLARSGTSFILGFLLCSLLVGCAAFKYRYYYVRMASYDGKLIASKPENDRGFELCMPSAQDANPCVVMFREEFFSLKEDYKKLQTQLEWCQRQ